MADQRLLNNVQLWKAGAYRDRLFMEDSSNKGIPTNRELSDHIEALQPLLEAVDTWAKQHGSGGSTEPIAAKRLYEAWQRVYGET